MITFCTFFCLLLVKSAGKDVFRISTVVFFVVVAILALVETEGDTLPCVVFGLAVVTVVVDDEDNVDVKLRLVVVAGLYFVVNKVVFVDSDVGFKTTGKSIVPSPGRAKE